MLRQTTQPNLDFLAEELRETARLTRSLGSAASHALSVLADQSKDDASRAAIDNLVAALQSQDRIEQRLNRLADFTRHADEPGGYAGIASEMAVKALALDELVSAFDRHLSGEAPVREDRISTVTPSRGDVELF